MRRQRCIAVDFRRVLLPGGFVVVGLAAIAVGGLLFWLAYLVLKSLNLPPESGGVSGAGCLPWLVAAPLAALGASFVYLRLSLFGFEPR